MQDREIARMQAEDKRYGEVSKGKRPAQKKVKNQVNYSRFSAQELMDMEDEDFEDEIMN